ncbi:MAG: hypothetical protein A2231_11335 [Candidatus Firestonebacteria bacterium RIFOXYA2_FULL_40_8]|nr:MAG: hypothetical protein A2231_11335 [Candidatus Firestonebacteria bacterium RIFOXYA2_FULL_40_8]
MPKGKDIKRISTFLTQDELEYLDKLSSKAKFTGGFKLSRAEILRSLVKAMKELKVDVSKVKSEDQLKERILKAVK